MAEQTLIETLKEAHGEINDKVTSFLPRAPEQMEEQTKKDYHKDLKPEDFPSYDAYLNKGSEGDLLQVTLSNSDKTNGSKTLEKV